MKRLWTVALLTGGLCVMPLTASASFTNIFSFGSLAGEAGKWPSASLVSDGSALYGMTSFGGQTNGGTVFRIDLADSSYTNLHVFNSSDGRSPLGSLLMTNGTFYGMTARGGSSNVGVVFSMALDGTGYQVLHDFEETALNGAMPWGSLVALGDWLYGMTYCGGAHDLGTIFRLHRSTQVFELLHSFAAGEGDGSQPQGDLLVFSNRLYGMTTAGGAHGSGVIFGIDPDGSGYANLYEFDGENEGGNPAGGLLWDAGRFYGMARGGAYGAGLIFSIADNGTGYQVLHSFDGSAEDGAEPYGSLIKHNDRFYGLTRLGGTNSQGTVFSFGASYSNLHSFTRGGEPYGALVLDDAQLYGMAFSEGTRGRGTVFRIDPAGSDTAAWSALAWIDDGGMGQTLLGDANSRVMYVRHNTDGGEPDQAWIGYGQTPDADDATWTWQPMARRPELVEGDYEYTGTLGRAAATGTYYVAARFAKGVHVYYPPASGDWNTAGDWNTPLNTTNTWTVTPLTKPSNASATYQDANTLQLSADGDGTHWIVAFRKPGASATFTAPENGTAYTTGTSYSAEGDCVYHGPAGSFVNGGLAADSVYRYAFYTENWSYYSTAEVIQGSTVDPNADDDGDGLPNWWEEQYFAGSTAAVTNLDSDGDGQSNWEEFVALTDPTDDADVFGFLDNTYSSDVGTTPNYGTDLVSNGDFSVPGSSSDPIWGTAAYWEEGQPDSDGERWGNAHRSDWKNHAAAASNFCGIISGDWMGSTSGGMQQDNNVSASGVYRARGWFWVESNWTADNAFELVFVDGFGNEVGGVTNDLSSAGAAWTEVSMIATAPASAVRAQLSVQSENIGAAGTFYFDDIALQQVTYDNSEQFNLQWTAKPGRSYWVEYCDQPVGGSWQGLASNITAASEQAVSVTDTNLAGVVNRCYRLGVQLP